MIRLPHYVSDYHVVAIVVPSCLALPQEVRQLMLLSWIISRKFRSMYFPIICVKLLSEKHFLLFPRMLFPSLPIILSAWLAFSQTALGASCTSPPTGAHVVRRKSTRSGEFATITSAVNALPQDFSAQTIFIYPGTYTERVHITRPGPLTVRC